MQTWTLLKLAATAALAAGGAGAAPKLNVVATTPDLAALARFVQPYFQGW